MGSVFINLVLVLHMFTFLSSLSRAADPNILFDFILPPNVTTVDGNFFTYTGLRGVVASPAPQKFTATQASLAEFPALNGQSVSFSVLQFPPGAVSAPHARPRASGLLFLLKGSLEVGFVDTKNKLYAQTLEAGDMFIFPKGLVHYQYNSNQNESAMAIAAFGSASAATVSVPATVFESDIDDEILAKSFETDVATIEKIKAGLAAKR